MSTQANPYHYELRIVACTGCGAPVEGPLEGGSASCAACGYSNQIFKRDELRDRELAGQAPTMSEPKRLKHLRTQPTSAPPPPAAIAHLLVDGAIPEQNIPAALAEWLTAKREVATGGPPEASDRLFALTERLHDPLLYQGRAREARNLIETTLDFLKDPSRRQILICTLARNAARFGDINAGERWLNLCAEHADELHADSAFRVTRAYLSTIHGDPATVLRVLGSAPEDVPIADELAELAALLRAHGLEKSRQRGTAVSQLVELLYATDRAQRMDAIVVSHPELGLCPKSYPEAKQLVVQTLENAVKVKRRSVSPLLLGGLIVGGVAVLGGLSVAIAQLLNLWGAFVFMAIGAAIIPIAGTVIWTTVSGSKYRQRLITGSARVVTANATGQRSPQGLPIYQLMLTVELPGRAAFVALVTDPLPPDQAAQATAGTTLAVEADPNNQRDIGILWRQTPPV